MNSSKSNVLVVDDDPRTCKLIRRLADKRDLGTTVVSEFDRMMSSYDRLNPEKIFLNLLIPGIDGIEPLAFLREKKSISQIHLVSSYDIELLRASYKLGRKMGLNMCAPIHKPFSQGAIDKVLVKKQHTQAQANSPWSSLSIGSMRLDLVNALQNQEILPFYQPIVDLKSGKIQSLEALCRWQHKKHGYILPEVFLPEIRAMNLSMCINLSLLDYTLEDMKCWDSMGMTPHVSINLSPGIVETKDLPDRIISKVRSEGIEPSRICFEIAESEACCASLEMLNNISRLHEEGFKLALDNFGTVHADLEGLLGIPFDVVKISRRLIRDVLADNDSQALVRSAVSLGKAMNFSVVAEGIEDAETYKWLIDEGCLQGQGFHIFRPGDFNKSIAILKKNDTTVGGNIEQIDCLPREDVLTNIAN